MEQKKDVEYTCALIKPDALEGGHLEAIEYRIVQEGFEIVERREVTFDRELAEKFYEELKGQVFFDNLIAYMTR
jgi:nucleoside diphosphate kinase